MGIRRTKELCLYLISTTTLDATVSNRFAEATPKVRVKSVAGSARVDDEEMLLIRDGYWDDQQVIEVRQLKDDRFMFITSPR